MRERVVVERRVVKRRKVEENRVIVRTIWGFGIYNAGWGRLVGSLSCEMTNIQAR